MIKETIPQEEIEICISTLKENGFQIHSLDIDPKNFMNMIISYSKIV